MLTPIVSLPGGVSSNWASWFLPISTIYDHTYSLQAYVTNDGYFHTSTAPYAIFCCGTSQGVTRTIFLDQQVNQGGFCYILGNQSMWGSLGGYVQARNGVPQGSGWLYVDIFCYRTQ